MKYRAIEEIQNLINENERLESQLADRDAQIAEATCVLAPSMSQSGLVDACRQVKQAAISWADNAEKLDARIAILTRQLATARKAMQFVIAWNEFPMVTPRDGGEPISYGYAYGSNGQRDFMREKLQEAIAAIDAPAATTEPPHHHSNTCVLDRFGKCTAMGLTPDAPTAAEPLPSGCSAVDWCELHQIDHGHPEPPEPAGDGDCGGCDAGLCEPSAVPFTAEEAREEARLDVARINGRDFQPPLHTPARKGAAMSSLPIEEILIRMREQIEMRDAEIATIRAENAEMLKDAWPRKWSPIGTAPKDGREVLLRVKLRAGILGRMLVGHYLPGGHCVEDHPPIDRGWYLWNGSLFDKTSEPTHWMPLPVVELGLTEVKDGK